MNMWLDTVVQYRTVIARKMSRKIDILYHHFEHGSEARQAHKAL